MAPGEAADQIALIQLDRSATSQLGCSLVIGAPTMYEFNP